MSIEAVEIPDDGMLILMMRGDKQSDSRGFNTRQDFLYALTTP
jgi:hypothetical protein